MRGWDQLMDGYLTEYGSRGLFPGTVARTTRVLEQWDGWMRGRRPRPRFEQIDADFITRFIRARTTFRSGASSASTNLRYRTHAREHSVGQGCGVAKR